MIILKIFEKIEYAYIEVNYSKFTSEHFLLKIYSCKNDLNICIFSETRRIFTENRNTFNYKEVEEIGVKQIEEFKQYDVNSTNYIFVYNYKNYYDTLDDILIYINNAVDDVGNYDDYYYDYIYAGYLEVFNHFMEKFVFDFRHTESIRLLKEKVVVSYGKYYIIFKYSRGATFSIHNSLHMFPFNKIDTFCSETKYILSTNRLLFFSMNLEKDIYFYSFSYSHDYLYSIDKRTIQLLEFKQGFTHFIPKGNYLLISNYKETTTGIYAFSYSINRYLLDIKPNIEYSVLSGFKYIKNPSKIGVIDLSKYKNNTAYLTTDGNFYKSFSCQETLTVEETMYNNNYDEKPISSYLFPFSKYIRCFGEYPYINFKLFPSKFEVVQEAYYINSSQTFIFKQNDTVAFDVYGGDLILIQSTQENLKKLDNLTEFHKTLFIQNNIQFKIKLNENIETNLTIDLFENKNNISIYNLTDFETVIREIYNKKEDDLLTKCT